MRTPLPYPDVATLGGHKALAPLAAVLSSLPPAHRREDGERALAVWISPALQQRIREETRDQLSDLLTGAPRRMSAFLDRRSIDPVGHALCAHADLPMTVERLQRLAGRCVGKARQAIRCSDHRTAPDRNGLSAVFIAPHHVIPALERICQLWNGLPAKSPEHGLAAALWILVATLNAHAFRDGNGRLARVLFSGSLARAGLLNNGYLPLAPLIYASQGNFEIAIRRAELEHDWAPIIRVITRLMTIYVEILPAFLAHLEHDSQQRSDSHG